MPNAVGPSWHTNPPVTTHPSAQPIMAIAVQVRQGLGPGLIAFQPAVDEIAAGLRETLSDALGRSVFVTAAHRFVGGVGRATNFGVFDRIARPGEDRAALVGELDLLGGREQSAQGWNLAALVTERLLEQGLREVVAEALESFPVDEAPSIEADVGFEPVEDHLVTQLVFRRRRRNGKLGRAFTLEWDEQAVPSNQPFVPCQPLSRVFVETRRNLAAALGELADSSRLPSHGVLGALALRGAFPARIPILLPDPAQPIALEPATLDLFYLTFEMREDGPLAGMVAQVEGREGPRRPCVRIEGPSTVRLRSPREQPELTLRAVTVDLRAPLSPQWRVVNAVGASVTVLQPISSETVVRVVPFDPVHQRHIAVEMGVAVSDVDGLTVDATRTIAVEVPVFTQPVAPLILRRAEPGRARPGW